MRFLSIVVVSFILLACHEDMRSPGKPLMELDFNGQIINKGIYDVQIEGDALVSYHYDVPDTCLDLMASAKYRKPLVISYNEGFSFDDYEGYTFSVWVQKAKSDNEDYCILSQQEFVNDRLLGWELRAENCGSWSWVYRDSLQTWTYKPASLNQAINNGKWHHLVFSYNKNIQEARLYFDGMNVAIYSMYGNTFNIESTPIRLGVSPSSASVNMDVFNGRLDDLAVWSRSLIDEEVKTIYGLKYPHKFTKPVCGDQLKVMTWDVWQGGIHEGKRVGPERILDVIRSTEADIILLQEMAGKGSYLADGLGYYFYQRNEDLGVLSRYPLQEANNVYRSYNSGCIKVDLGDDRYLFASPVALSQQPRLDAYLKSGEADPDTIVYRENEFRGKEITFILGELRHLIFTNENIPMILGGGFYSGSHLDWDEANKDQHMGLVVNYPVSQQLEKAGFIDTYKALNAGEPLEKGFTWSTKFNSAFPDRTDFIYSFGDRLYPVDSYVLDDHLVSFPSSHAAVVTVFNFEKD